MRALVVAPHPDDAELACAALLGPECAILTLTGAGTERAEEAERAAKVTGSLLLLTDGIDGHLAATADLVEAVEEVVRATRATVVACPPLLDEHQDHREAAAAVRSATRRSGLTVVEYETPSTPPEWTPDTFLPLTPEQERTRERALAEHVSQRHRSYVDNGVLRGRARARGAWVGVRAAEAYRTVRRTQV